MGIYKLRVMKPIAWPQHEHEAYQPPFRRACPTVSTRKEDGSLLPWATRRGYGGL